MRVSREWNITFALLQWFCHQNWSRAFRDSAETPQTDRSSLRENRSLIWRAVRFTREELEHTKRGLPDGKPSTFVSRIEANEGVSERVRCNFSTCTSGGRAAMWYIRVISLPMWNTSFAPRSRHKVQVRAGRSSLREIALSVHCEHCVVETCFQKFFPWTWHKSLTDVS